MPTEKIEELPKDFSSEIGRISLHFAYLEREMRNSVDCLLDLSRSDLGYAVTAELSCKALRNLLGSLHKIVERDTEIIAELDNILNQITKIEEKRNVILHSLWRYNSRNDTIERIKSTAKSKGLSWQFQAFDLSMLKDFVFDIGVVRNLLKDFIFSNRTKYSSLFRRMEIMKRIKDNNLPE